MSVPDWHNYFENYYKSQKNLITKFFYKNKNLKKLIYPYEKVKNNQLHDASVYRKISKDFLSKQIGLDKKNNIRINCISPGGIEDNQPKKFKLRYKRSCNSKGLLSGNDVANAALFLISKESQFINGQNIIVDDGWLL